LRFVNYVCKEMMMMTKHILSPVCCWWSYPNNL